MPITSLVWDCLAPICLSALPTVSRFSRFVFVFCSRGAGVVKAALPGVDAATVHAGLEHAAVGVQNLMYTIADSDAAEATAAGD